MQASRRRPVHAVALLLYFDEWLRLRKNRIRESACIKDDAVLKSIDKKEQRTIQIVELDAEFIDFYLSFLLLTLLPYARQKSACKRKADKTKLRLVLNIAKHYENHWATLLDIIREYNIGLIRAAEKSDLPSAFVSPLTLLGIFLILKNHSLFSQ